MAIRDPAVIYSDRFLRQRHFVRERERNKFGFIIEKVARQETRNIAQKGSATSE